VAKEQKHLFLKLLTLNLGLNVMRFLIGASAICCMLDMSASFAQFKRPDAAPQPQMAAPNMASNDMARIAAASGIFDLKASKGSNSCRITLWPEGAKGKFPVSMPAGCNKAFPGLLAKVKNWTLGLDGAIGLADDKVVSLLEFREANGKLLSPEINTLTYELKPADAGWFKRQMGGSRTDMASATAKGPDAAEINRVAGTYAISRGKGITSECKIIFTAQSGLKPNQMKADLVDGCQDRGMQIFNPNAWRLETSRLVLFSRKGHETGFVRSAAGGWVKEKQSGDMLELVKQ
jgi:Protease inhibitor Inh